jgi:hypothetical protein
VHTDAGFGFSVLVPDGWQRLALTGSETGCFYAPDAADLLSGLAIEPRDLGTAVRASDLAALRHGLRSGLSSLTDARLETFEADAVAELLTLEARYTFVEDGSRRKRWVRLLYQRSTQLRLVAQAATEEAFAYWEPMFFEAMRTVHFGTYI